MKGFFKGFKNMFAGKEHEMEIGFPTDVKHVSHIGWDSTSDNAPCWMKEFKTAAGYTTASLSTMGNMESNWLNRVPESKRSLSESFDTVSKSTSTREPGKPSRKIRRKKKVKNPGSPSSSTCSPTAGRNKSHIKSKSTSCRPTCGASMEDACVATSNPYRASCAHEIT